MGVVLSTPLVEMQPRYSRQSRTTTYQTVLERVERYDPDAVRRVDVIDRRLKELEEELAKVENKLARTELEKEQKTLTDERRKVVAASAPKNETGTLTHAYVAAVQAWVGRIRLSAEITAGSHVWVVDVDQPITLRERVRVAANPEKGLKAADEWIDEKTARTEAIELARLALFAKLLPQVQERMATCARARATGLEGTEQERQRELSFRSLFFGAALAPEESALVGPPASAIKAP